MSSNLRRFFVLICPLVSRSSPGSEPYLKPPATHIVTPLTQGNFRKLVINTDCCNELFVGKCLTCTANFLPFQKTNKTNNLKSNVSKSCLQIANNSYRNFRIFIYLLLDGLGQRKDILRRDSIHFQGPAGCRGQPISATECSTDPRKEVLKKGPQKGPQKSSSTSVRSAPNMLHTAIPKSAHLTPGGGGGIPLAAGVGRGAVKISLVNAWDLPWMATPLIRSCLRIEKKARGTSDTQNGTRKEIAAMKPRETNAKHRMFLRFIH
jgi:hypothetical protein